MGIKYTTSIIVPDYTNNRIVQVNDITGAGWITKVSTDFTFTTAFLTSFYPTCIDLDSQGRIYIGTVFGSAGEPKIIRINSIEAGATPAEVVVGDAYPEPRAIAIDRVNNILYYTTTGNALYSMDLSSFDPATGGTPVDLLLTDAEIGPNRLLTGITVDDQGYVYVVNGMEPWVVKLDLSLAAGSRMIASYNTTLNTPYDVKFQSPYIYLTNYISGMYYENTTGTENKLIRLSTDMTGAVELNADPDIPTDKFYGPHHFAAILSDKIYIVDEGNSNDFPTNGYNLDRIVTVDDITGSGWTSYGSSGAAQDQFKFYTEYFC